MGRVGAIRGGVRLIAVTSIIAILVWLVWRPVAFAATGPAPCRTDQLSVQLRFGPGSGSAGHLTGALLLRNRSSSRCSLLGHPGVSFVDAHGRQIGIPADWTSAPAHSTAVAAGSTVGAQLTLVDVGVFSQGACRPTRAWGLRVYPPGRRRSLLTRHALTECRGTEHDATVGPVVPRSQLVPGSF